MRYAGTFCNDMHTLTNGSIRQALITDARAVIDWDDIEGGWHLEADSTDCTIYLGYYGKPRILQQNVIRLKRFNSPDRDIVLLCNWQEPGYEPGQMIFHLTPA